MQDRITARVLLIDRDRRVLMMKCRDFDPSRTHFWATIGGGVEPGETLFEAALRETREESGIEPYAVGPVVWYGEAMARGFTGAAYRFKESFIVAKCEAAPLSRANWTPLERDFMLDLRWWTLNDIQRSTERLFPQAMAALLPDVLAERYPSTPIIFPVRDEL